MGCVEGLPRSPVNSVTAMSVSNDVLARLRQALDRGEFSPGGRLPAERELARKFGVGRSSLRTALDQLEVEGRIWRHVGQGTFVTESQSAEVVTRLRFDSAPSPADVFELRQMVEPPVAAMAALRATSDEIERLGQLVDQGYRVANGEEWERIDDAFHRTLASASRNPLLLSVLETLNAVRGKKQSFAQRTYADDHRLLAESVRGRDPAAAASAMRTHLREVYGAILGDLAEATAVGNAVADGGTSA